MKVEIRNARYGEVHEALSLSKLHKISGMEIRLDYMALLSQYVWVGRVDGEIACVFGVIPPSVLSTTAYLWSISTDKVDDHKFLFVRYSQRMIERIHREFPRIIGHANPGDDRSIRWLKWLGAVFGEITEKGIPFVIERKNYGGA